MPPEQVGFVMEGVRPLPVDTKTASTVNSQPAQANNCYPSCASSRTQQQGDWSPYYPQVVMLPSGLMQVQQPATPGWYPQLCNYNRFPVVWSFGSGVIARGEGRSELVQSTLQRSPGRRILPPTWETSVNSCSPFLPPYPVAVLAHSIDHFSHGSSSGATDEKPSVTRIEAVECDLAATTKNPASRSVPVNRCAQSTPFTLGLHLQGYNAQWAGVVMPCGIPVHPTRQLPMQYIRPGLRLFEPRESPRLSFRVS